jgi:hypothetical protein
MYKNYFLAFFALCFLIISCNKAEIIPPPDDKVELTCNFKGFIGNREINFVQNVNGYTCIPDIGYNDQPGKPGERKYTASIKSGLLPHSIVVSVGNLKFQKQENEPNISDFSSYMLDNINFSYSKDASNGFEIRYTDELNQQWVSDPSSKNTKSILFTATSVESDPSNDYCKFSALFSCWVYRDVTINGAIIKDSLEIKDGQFKGWFSRTK